MSHLLLAALLVAALVPTALAGEARRWYRVGDGDARLDAVAGAVELGLPEPVSVDSRELVVDVPVRIKPVGVSGRIERIEFRDLALNGVPFSVDPYDAAFDLPETDPVTLPSPLRLRVRFLDVAPGVVRESLMPSETLRLTGRVTVAGEYRKWLFSLRRAVEIPIDATGPNPIAAYHPAKRLFEEGDGWSELTDRLRRDTQKLELNLQKLRIPAWPF
jgi:hypothetical protein